MTETNDERPPSLSDFEGASEAEIAALPPDERRLVRAERACWKLDMIAMDLTTEYQRRAVFDKSDWGDGAWQTEPDLVMWRAKAPPHYRCMVARSFFGSLNGYVAIPPGHPAHGVVHQRLKHVPSHRGLSFSGHATAEHWVLGFDCGHGFDIQPASNARLRQVGALPGFMSGDDDGMGEVFRMRYRDLPYVREVVEALAAALAKIAADGVLPPEGSGFDDEETTEREP